MDNIVSLEALRNKKAMAADVEDAFYKDQVISLLNSIIEAVQEDKLGAVGLLLLDREGHGNDSICMTLTKDIRRGDLYLAAEDLKRAIYEEE